MKKLSYIVMALLLIASLASCGNSAEPNASSVPTSSPTPMTTAAPSPSTNVKAFPISASKLIDAMAKSFEGSEYGNAFIADPSVAETDDITYGKVTTYTFTVCDGVQCIVYETKADEKVYSVFLIGDSSKMQTDDAKIYGAYAAVLIDGFENKKDVEDVIHSKLDIANSGFTDGTINMANGSVASFTYIVDDGIAMLLISAL